MTFPHVKSANVANNTMEKMEEKLWAYGTLSLEEKHSVDQYVAMHPEYAPLLGEVQALYEVLAAAGFADSPGDLALAYYVAHEVMTGEGMPMDAGGGALGGVFSKLRRRLDKDREAHARYLLIKARMEAIAADSDPVAHFEKLTGEKVDPLPPARSRSQERDRKASREDRPPTVREPAIYSSRKSRGVLYSLAVLVTALLLLLQVNRDARLGYMDPGSIVLEMPSGMRGIDQPGASGGFDAESSAPGANDLSQANPIFGSGALSPGELAQWGRFRTAAEKMLGGQSVYFGVYYRSDGVALEEARRLFERLLAEEAGDARVAGYAKLMLAKINIASHRHAEAAQLLREIAGDEILADVDATLATRANRLLAKLKYAVDK